MTRAADSITGIEPPLAASPHPRLANSESASILQRRSPFLNRTGTVPAGRELPMGLGAQPVFSGTGAHPLRLAVASQQRRISGAVRTAGALSTAPLWQIRPSATVRRSFSHLLRGLARIAGAAQSAPNASRTSAQTALQCSGVEREDTGDPHVAATHPLSSSASFGPDR
jgi:hypothetical protein